MSRRVAICLAGLVAVFIIGANSVPFNAKATYSAGTPQMSSLGPKNRVQAIGKSILQSADLTYFITKMPFRYEHAHLSFKVKTGDLDQAVAVGFQDQEQNWHFNSKVVQAGFINQVSWDPTGSRPVLYQRQRSYSSPQQFITNPPTNKVIGLFDYDSQALENASPAMPDYKPQATDTVISTPLRGSVVLYAYLKNEPFKMEIEKRDINWDADPDQTTISVYKQRTKVFQVSLGDDGDEKADHKIGGPQTASIHNPGPGLPEAGVYKIVIDQSADSVISKITTNLHELVFQGPIYPVSNHEVFGNLVDATMATTLYTNAQVINAISYHLNQVITANGKPVMVKKGEQQTQFAVASDASVLILPNSDMVLNGIGYFAFKRDQFFTPSPYHLLSIQGTADLQKVDYILTNYERPKQEPDGWVDVQCDFDLGTAAISRGKLNWVIQAPGLTENHRTIEIKDIQMTLTKKGWLRR